MTVLISESVRLTMRVMMPGANSPPFASAPWHDAQRASKVCLPAGVLSANAQANAETSITVIFNIPSDSSLVIRSSRLAFGGHGIKLVSRLPFIALPRRDVKLDRRLRRIGHPAAPERQL